MPTGPIITLTTDFGLTDFYVAAMKAVLLQHCPNATLVDITHSIYRQDLVSGSFTLQRAVASFGPAVTHLAVVDPGVGTDRRMLIVEMNGSRVICPDNGLITWAWRRGESGRVGQGETGRAGAVARELTWRPRDCSNTFHGRDIMAPVAGMLAAGWPIITVTGAVVAPVLLDLHLSDSTSGQIIHVDHFGNAVTNIPAEAIGTTMKAVRVGGSVLIPIRRTYADVAVGEPVALVGSSDLLEIAIRNGSAAEILKLEIGDPLDIV